jgi:CHAT domain-containing protein/tetratricopeptide (TPR) repeat protein
MTRILVALFVAVGIGVGLVAAEEAPYKRLLQGDDAKKAEALDKLIAELWATGKFAEAVAPAEQLRDLRQRVQGEKHWEASDAARQAETLRKAAALPAPKRVALADAPAMSAKAEKLDQLVKYAQAESLYRQALAVFEEVLGPQHPDTAESYHKLAFNLDAQGRFKEAEPLFRKALAVFEEVLGPKHPLTATSYNDLALNVQAQGRAHEAEPLYRRALAVREQVLGPRHSETAKGYNNLAYNLDAQGRAKEAEPLHRQALAVKEEVLGPKHPSTALSYNNLAYNLAAQGRAQEAETLYRKALAVREVALGPRHPLTAQSYLNLATNLDDQGRYKEAEPLKRRALAIKEEALGPRHPAIAIAYNNLAYNLNAQGRTQEAERLYRQALAVNEEALGPKHPNTAFSYSNVACILQAPGRTREAEPLHRRALAIREEVLGAKHPHTAQSYHNLASNLDAQGRAKEAETLYRKVLAVREEVLGPKHPHTASSSNGLAANLSCQGRAKEAETFYRLAVAGWEEVLGPKHPHTATSYNNLALNLQAQGRANEAEPLWQKGADGVEAARLRLATSTLDRAQAVPIQPHVGLAACRARLEKPADAWAAAEAGLARGLLDDLAARVSLRPDAEAQHRDGQRAARLDALDRLLTPLLTRETLDSEQRRRRDELLRERSRLDAEAAQVAAERSGRAVLPLATVQAALSPATAMVFWVDLPLKDDHWGCVVRHSGLPAWVRLKGSGPKGEWTQSDDKLPRLLRDDLNHGEPDAFRRAAQLAEQSLRPLEPHLAATDQLPAVRHLLVVPAGRMAGIPLEALTDRFRISYAPSGSVLAGLRQKHRPLEHPSLLALGDPNFRTADAGPPPKPPQHGLYLALVLPDSNAARAGLRGGDVLLSYNGTKLVTKEDLKIIEAGESVPVEVWRDGRTLDERRLRPGKLGVLISDDPPAVALRKRRELDLLADARSRGDLRPLPGTRLEVRAIASLLPRDKTTVLLGSKASEQELAARAAAGKLKEYRIVHLATHGKVDPVSAAYSALELARDQLPGPEEQAKVAVASKKVPTGRLTVGDIADSWQLDADLVVLSACQTALGPDGGGEGLLGFSQVLLAKGARSLVLSLWKVDDTATALLMTRFYQNLLGKTPLTKAKALQEAKHWLRTLPRAEVEKLAAELVQAEVRAAEEEPGPKRPAREVTKAAVPAGDMPFAHPSYWAAFILIGDPE